MKILISDLLRKLASAIQIDNTPTDKELEDIKNSRKKVDGPIKEFKVPKTLSNDDTVEHNVIKPTARPRIKPTRRKLNYEKGDWDSKQHRTEYMRNWRAEGKDVDTGNKYIKKKK